ncbi:flagellar biosynthesis protein [Aquabacterium sp. A3]|uniref:flagellar biosynthesis protein n=1 Tax=Aquabacterium sp. A3 TaxID=3132829 RepID=UPI00311A5945
MNRPERHAAGRTGSPPVDQAQGLRRMFATRVLRFIPVVASPEARCGGLVLERLCTAYESFGLRTLVVDASPQARDPGELVAFDIAEGIEALSSHVSYMPARGLPLRYADARGSCATLLDALADASPQSDVVLLHAPASELARVMAQRARECSVRPLVYTNDLAEGLTQAYAAVKVLAQRGGWMSYDLLVAAPVHSTQAQAVADRLARCADDFLGVAQRLAVQLDLQQAAQAQPDARFLSLASGLLHAALPHSLGDSAFEHLTSPGSALPGRVAPVFN